MKLSSFQQTKWTRLFPPAGWLANYRLAWLPSDAIAGVTLAAYAIPVSLAYAGLAGLPPQVGIYGYLLGGVGYASPWFFTSACDRTHFRHFPYDCRNGGGNGRRRYATIRADCQSRRLYRGGA